MRQIVSELSGVRYLKRIVVTLGRANEAEYRHAMSFFGNFEIPVTVLWMDSPEIQELLASLEERGLSAGSDGKGRSCWMAYGYLLACNDCDVIALHDCDIVNYSHELLARLCYPVVNPNLGFEFCKGFYARVTDRMHGRVTRLFVTPLIRAMQSIAPQASFLHFIDSFRYCLAGEFAMRTPLARVNRIPGDWGLEVGVLAEVYRADDPARGLRRMATDIAKSMFRTLAADGEVFSKDAFRSLQVRYVRMAEDTIHRYYADAMLFRPTRRGTGCRHICQQPSGSLARVSRGSARFAIDSELEPRGCGNAGLS
jgi:glucosyl-3-phosphoglycerate synthase